MPLTITKFPYLMVDNRIHVCVKLDVTMTPTRFILIYLLCNTKKI